MVEEAMNQCRRQDVGEISFPGLGIKCIPLPRYFTRKDSKFASNESSYTNLSHTSEVDLEAAMAPAKGDKYSVILPTYNERQNLPVLVQMLHDVFTKE